MFPQRMQATPTPAQVQEFVERTGVDSLAIAIGTNHGAYKFKPGTKPMLRFDILEEVEQRLPVSRSFCTVQARSFPNLSR